MCSHPLPASAANAQGKVQSRTDPDVQDANACHAGSKMEYQKSCQESGGKRKGLPACWSREASAAVVAAAAAAP